MADPKDRESVPAEKDLVDDEEEIPSLIQEVRQSNGGSITAVEAGFLVLDRKQDRRERERERKGFRKTVLGLAGVAVVIGGAIYGFGRFQGATEKTLETTATEAAKTSKNVEKVSDALTKHDRILVDVGAGLKGTEKAIKRLETGVDKNRSATVETRLEVEKIRREIRWRR